MTKRITCPPLLTATLILATLINCSSPEESESASASDFPKEFKGKVVAIIDGDTYDLLLPDNATIRIRMEGIDSPERGMPYYQVAKQHLASLCFGKEVRVVTSSIKDERHIAFSYMSHGIELSRQMLKDGFAWHFTKYNQDPQLARLEARAREQELGLWADKGAIAPWRIREKRKRGVSKTDSI